MICCNMFILKEHGNGFLKVKIPLPIYSPEPDGIKYSDLDRLGEDDLDALTKMPWKPIPKDWLNSHLSVPRP